MDIANPFGFERTSKRRRGYPSETQVKRGDRLVGGQKELIEKLGRNDPCPCGSGRRFQAVLPKIGPIWRFMPRPLLLENEKYKQHPRGAACFIFDRLVLTDWRSS